MVDITLLTDSRYVIAHADDWYIQNVLQEDQLVQDALEKKGLTVNKKAWSDPDYDWSQSRYLFFRTTWDYFDRLEAFIKWFESIQHTSQLINPAKLISWNLDKHYLKDLEDWGIGIIPTVYCEKGSSLNLRDTALSQGWQDLVIKPTVSGAAKDTYLLQNNELGEKQALFDELVRTQAMMVQPKQDYILNTGEISLIVIGGKFSHGVLKVAKSGDFRVQDDFGGTVHTYTPTSEEIIFAENAVSVCNPRPLYARVDMIYGNNGSMALVELELIEPELWFRRNPASATELAKITNNYLKKKTPT